MHNLNLCITYLIKQLVRLDSFQMCGRIYILVRIKYKINIELQTTYILQRLNIAFYCN